MSPTSRRKPEITQESVIGTVIALWAGRTGVLIPSGDIFKKNRPVLGPTQPPFQWVSTAECKAAGT